VISVAIEPKDEGRSGQDGSTLAHVWARRDPTFFSRIQGTDVETGQTIISGMGGGRLHLEVLVDRMPAVQVGRNIESDPKVAYRGIILRTGCRAFDNQVVEVSSVIAIFRSTAPDPAVALSLSTA